MNTIYDGEFLKEKLQQEIRKTNNWDAQQALRNFAETIDVELEPRKAVLQGRLCSTDKGIKLRATQSDHFLYMPNIISTQFGEGGWEDIPVTVTIVETPLEITAEETD